MNNRHALGTVPGRGFQLIGFDEKDIPPVKDGLIRVYPRYVGICGSDIQKIFSDKRFPFLGHEIVGMTADGKPVVVNPNMACHSCGMCNKGFPNLCNYERALGTTVNGALRGWMDVPSENLVYIDDLNPSYVLCDSLAVVLHGIEYSYRLTQNDCRDSVLVIGSGNIARLTVLLLNFLSIIPDVITKDGAWAYSSMLKVGQVLSLERLPTSHCRYGTVFECIGFAQSKSIEVALQCTQSRGELIVFGVFPDDYRAAIILRSLFEREVVIQGVRSFLPKNFQQAKCIVEKEMMLIHQALPQTIIAAQNINAINDSLHRSSLQKLIIDFGDR